jgi:hypothetical protein
MRRLLLPCTFSAVLLLAPQLHADNAAVPPATTDTTTAPNAKPATAADWAARAHDAYDKQHLDEAIKDASYALDLDPKNLSALELRGTAYGQQKLWDFAERDYLAAKKISPDPAYDYALGEIHYLQRDYSGARPHFASRAHDERLGDLCSYMVFLCDTLGGHENLGAADLAAFRQADNKPSYYYAHIAWDLIYGNREEVNTYYAIAMKRYGESVKRLYFDNLLKAQRFQMQTASFTTRDGHSYQHIPVTLEVDGLRFKTDPTHWTTLSVLQIGDDLSGFPDDLREEITRRIVVEKEKIAPTTKTVSFTTKAGKTFHDVRYYIEDAGLAVLTPEGWSHIPFNQLPDEPGALPQSLREALETRRQSVASSLPGSVVASFSTRSGKVFTDERCSLGDNGVTVVTDQGWVIVPFSDLPADLSPFPSSWQTRIKAGASAENDAPMQTMLTFTTRTGRTYADVRTSLGDEGLRVVTENGWVVVPYAQLGDDLTPFPSGWRDRIKTAQKAPPKTPSSR